MTIELAQWRLFLAVADRGSLMKAAATLRTDQPALSRSLRRLERLVGAPLFRRSSQGVVLTELGLRLQASVAELVGHADAVEAAAHAEARRAGGQLRVGTVDIYPISAAIAGACRDLSADPGLPLDAEPVALAWLAHPRALLDRDIDVGFTLTVDGRPHDPRSLRSRSLWEETSWSALISDQHPLTAAESVHPHELTNLPLHLPDRENNPDIHQLMLEGLADAGVMAPLRAPSLGTFADVLAQIAAGDGWTISAGTVPRHPLPGIVARPLEVSTRHTVQFSIMWHVNADLEAVRALEARFVALMDSASGASAP